MGAEEKAGLDDGGALPPGFDSAQAFIGRTLPPPLPNPKGEATLLERIGLWLAPNMTAFIASFCIMVIELVAGRVIARYMGASLYTWTAVIGIVLAGITIGNLLGGRLADWFRPVTTLAALFLLASAATALIPLFNQWVHEDFSWSTKPEDINLFTRLLFWLSGGEQPPAGEDPDPLAWSAKIFGHVLLVFLLPSTILGTIGPVVAKMALDQGRQIGRTVGNVYAWGALGSIVGTFFTGYYLVAKMGTELTILCVAGLLGIIGLIFSIVRLRGATDPRAAVISFLLLLPAFIPPSVGAICYVQYRGDVSFKVVDRTYNGVPQRVVRAVPNDDKADRLPYLDESDYSFIKITNQPDPGDPDDIRDLILDHLIHAHFIPSSPNSLRYDYEEIYRALTHRFLPPKGDDPGRPSLSALFIGGGGYVYPRYLRSVWHDCYIEVAEIDPAVTAAVIAEFGMDEDTVQIVKRPSDRKRKDNPIWIYHMDARNHIEDLVRRKESGEEVPVFDYIYGDAFNDYTVPFHLTTEEFTQKIAKLLRPDSGIYMINVIEVFDSGKFLGAIYNTFRRVFGDNVYVFANNENEPRKEERDTYIVVGAKRPLDLSDLPGKEEPYEFEGCLLNEKHIEALTDDQHGGSFVLTDDHAPVENFLLHVVSRR